MPYFSTSSPTSGNATQLQGRAVSPTGPVPGAVLTFVGTGATGSWVPALGTPGPQGPAGLDGPIWYSGAGAPATGVGASGDWWVDTANGRLYGPKLSGSWGAPLQLASGPAGPTGERGAAGNAGPTGAAGQSITGPTGSIGSPGLPGVRWYRGFGAPTASLGADGDMYLDSTAAVLYGPKASSSWPAGIPLVGPTGPSGGGGGGGGASSWDDLTGKPSTFAPSAHAGSHATGGSDPLTLAIGQIAGLQTALDGKQAAGSYAASSHTHAASDITSGVIAAARLASSGTASASTFLRGDGAWAAAGSTNASDLTTGTLAYARMADATVTTPAQITSNQNNYAGFARGINRFTADAARDLTGVVAGNDGEVRLLVNVGSFALTLKHQSASSTAANRFTVPWSGDCVISASGGSAAIVYDATSGTWRVL